MTIITKGMGAIIKSLGKGQGMVKGAGKKAGPKAVPKAIPKPKKFRLTKTDDAFVAGAGIGTAVTSEIHREKNKTPSPHRTRKGLGGVLTKIGKALSKKKPTPKPAPKEPKIGSKEWFDKAGPFERRRYVQMRESAKKGDVYNKAGQIMGRPHSERSAESIKKYVGPGAHQKGKK
jgi:hypothetical protein